MVDVIKINLWGKELGALSWDTDLNFGSFEFFNDFLSQQLDVSPLHMPIKSSKGKIYNFPSLNEETYKGLPGMLSDVLPDDFGNTLIDQWLVLNSIKRSDFSPLDRLLYIGKRGMGALEFEPARKLGYDSASIIKVDKLVELSKMILTKREKLSLTIEQTEELNELIKVGTSAGGQRAKAIICYNQKTKEIRSGQGAVPKGFEHYLLKFDGVTNEELGDLTGYGRIEYAYYLMAVDCGIDMMPSELLEENGRAHFMTKRFDRIGNNEKLHMQTLCSMAHFDYKKPGVYGYEDAFDVMRKLSLPQSDAIKLFKRIVFNVAARNQDDHTKNISFLMDKRGKWHLSPAYDMTYAYNPSGIWTNNHQMTINGKRDNITLEDLLMVGDKINYKKSKEEIDRISKVISNWNIYADKAGIPKQQAAKLFKAFRCNF
ncbi:MAG: type II toxin-antitoxin system HipA family toxin [Flavobacteriaceae bacterium]